MSDIFQNKRFVLKALSLGVLASLAVIVILMCVTALILGLTASIPVNAMEYIMIGVSGIAVLIGSYIAAACAKSGGLIIGLLCGAIVWLCCLMAGFAFNDDSVSVLTVIRIGVMLMCGAVGGIRGVNKKERIHIR